LCKLKLGLTQQIGSLQEESKELKDSFRRKLRVSALAKLTIAGVVWHIRKERNRRIFHQED